MRKITQQSLEAFINNRNFRSGNMEVEVIKEETRMKLHGNTIATLNGKELFVSACGWHTPTTKERINSVLRHFDLGYLYTKKFKMYFKSPIIGVPGEIFNSKVFKVN